MEHNPAVTRFLFDQARDIILVIRVDDGQIIDANKAASAAYGYSRAELLELRVFDLRPDHTPSVSAQMQIADRDGIQFEAVHRRRDGSTFPVEVSSRGVTVANQRCLFSIVRDISERKRFEADRDALLETTQQALAQREDFLVIASHELRTPVSNVALQLQQLLRLLERDATPRERVVGAARAALLESRRLGSLIDALLDAQLDKQPLELRRTELELGELLSEVVERMRPRAEQAGSEISVAGDPLRGSWDRLRLDQAFTNLVMNALKFGRGKPVRLRMWGSDEAVHVEVIDQGIGIRAEDAQRIFDKFERAIPSHHGGLGLGLFIARQMVEAHGGRLEVESTPGVGSTFRVTLPRG